MHKTDIYKELQARNVGPGLTILLVLSKEINELSRRELTAKANEILIQGGCEPLLDKRAHYEKYLAMLEGAALINYRQLGSTYAYSLSEIGQDFVRYLENQN